MTTSIHSFCMPLSIIPRAKGKNQRFTVCKTRGNRRRFFPSETLFYTRQNLFGALLSLYFLGGESFFLRSAKISPPKPRSFFRRQSLSRASSTQKNFCIEKLFRRLPYSPCLIVKVFCADELFSRSLVPRGFSEGIFRARSKHFGARPRFLFSADKLWLPLHYPIDFSPLSPRENISFTHRNALCPPLSASRRCFFG